MVRDHWQFTTPPFTGSLDPATFHCGGPQEEALARLEWLLEERQRCALVTGVEGVGKSHLASVAVRRLGGLGAETAMLSLRGLASGDWLDLLVARLPLDPMSRAEPIRPWQKVENRLRENALMDRPTALIFEDIDHAPPDALDGIARIVGAAEPLYARTVVVATATSAGLSRVPDAIRSRAAVRVELTPWSEGDVAGFLAGALSRGGGRPDIFTPEAVGTLTRFAGGIPRVVCQLAHLATVAAAGDALPQIDAAVIEGVWRELAPAPATNGSSRATPAAAVVEDDGDDVSSTASPPKVRVVRRLWG